MSNYYIDSEQRIKPQALNIKELLEGKYIVPDLQRDYEWDKKQLSKMWADILQTYKTNISNDGSHVDKLLRKPHFMGAFVVLKKQESEDGEKVIDGQQRLTSLYILMSVLLDKVNLVEDLSEKFTC